MPTLTVDRNYIEMNGQRINRPNSCSPSQWLEFWEPLDDTIDQLDFLNGERK